MYEQWNILRKHHAITEIETTVVQLKLETYMEWSIIVIASAFSVIIVYLKLDLRVWSRENSFRPIQGSIIQLLGGGGISGVLELGK